VGGCIHPSWKKRRQSFSSSQGSNHSRGVKLCSGVVGPWGFEESVLFQLAHIVLLLFMPQ
jgi:hypothetical protein